MDMVWLCAAVARRRAAAMDNRAMRGGMFVSGSLRIEDSLYGRKIVQCHRVHEPSTQRQILRKRESPGLPVMDCHVESAAYQFGNAP